MSNISDPDNRSPDNEHYGPLSTLIGTWQGREGKDVSPEPDGIEHNAYEETLTCEPIGDITNAEDQQLWALRYHQTVNRIRDGKHIHDQVGYWAWDKRSNTITQSATIPRGVSIVASGTPTLSDNGGTCINICTSEIISSIGNENSQSPTLSAIAQTPFMDDNARTTRYSLSLQLSKNSLSYSQTVSLEIYGKVFDHTDSNTLYRVK